jgi:hypothetical protein
MLQPGMLTVQMWRPAKLAQWGMVLMPMLSSGLATEVPSPGFTICPAWISAVATFLPPMGSVTPLPEAASVLLKRNWKVGSSLASPLLSTWISYSAFGSGAKHLGPP